ncbi:hypothetical protein DW957_05225 [Dorea formicigenerans]|uniref:Uncharacterized protein n=1 Tax=Dorea formicigenerans TaxID=39486 RepID=A0A413QLP7_9FIRM|nr:hypothetical protein DW957_05225 [Dorea formicigenerans]
MKIKLIDFGVPEHQRPYRPHGNDAGADVYLPMTAPYSPEKSPKFLLVLDWKYRMGMQDISFPVPVWR